MSDDRIADLERRVQILEMRLAAIDPMPDAEGWITNAHANDKATLALIAEKYGAYTIGEPHVTEKRTAAEIAADGIVGVYVDAGEQENHIE